MIRIRFFGPGELIQNGFSDAQYAAPAPVVEFISPASTVSHAAPAHVVECISPACAAPAVVVENKESGASGEPRSTRASAVCSASTALRPR